jgi:hypothetical protein
MHAHFINKAVCLQSHLNTDPLNQTANKQVSEKQQKYLQHTYFQPHQ